LKNLQSPNILKLLIAVNELNINPLISHIQEFLIEHQTEFLYQNSIDILDVYQHERFAALWNFCLVKICEEPKILFDSDKFINLKTPLLELLLKRDDLNMSEIEIWERLLRRCIIKQNIKNDPTKWSKEDTTKIKRELNRLIPLIQFYDIITINLIKEICGYKDILPQDLIYNLLEYHIVHNMKSKASLLPRKPKFEFQPGSTLIGTDHITLFASWIDRKHYSYYSRKKVPYDFKLLYKSCHDGIDTKYFHKNCDKKGATIWIAKIKDSTQLIGGYNPLDWSGDYWKYTADSFIFNFRNREVISTANVSYVNKKDRAVFCHINYGPTMGNLYCNNNNWTNIDRGERDRYPNVGIPANFEVEYYEVFQVIKK
jgi:hypothetical protein